MTLREILRFEFSYQVRRPSTWLYVAVLFLIALVWTGENYLGYAQDGDYLLNAPFIVAEVMLVGCMFWMLLAAYVAGEAAARDAETGMDPLIFTTPISKANYLGGRFLAAFVLNALILLAVPGGILLGIYSAGVEPQILGPLQPSAYLTAYAFIALPNAFVTTAVQFSFAVLGRRAVASYLGGLLLFVAAFVVIFLDPKVRGLLDPLGVIALDDIRSALAPIELNTRLIALEGSWLANRFLWFAFALGSLAFAHYRFRFCHATTTGWWTRAARGRGPRVLEATDTAITKRTPISVPAVQRAFGFASHARQTLAIGWDSFTDIARSRGGLLLLAVVTLLATASLDLDFMGVPLTPRTDYVLHTLAFPGVPPAYLIIPLLIVFCAGRLAWRERETGVHEMVDATPAPEWVLFLGKFLGLGLVLIVCMGLRMLVGIIAQLSMGHFGVQIGLYLEILFGMQLADYFLLGLLALVVHVVVNQKQMGHVAVIVVLIGVIAARGNEIGHELLVYGYHPGWGYTDMSGFGRSLGPWFWFHLYWTAWALGLAVMARLLWVRGKGTGLGSRVRMMRSRMTRSTAGVGATAGGLGLGCAVFIFYNTTVIDEYSTADESARRAQYERLYRRYEGIPQPRLTGTTLHVDLHPDRGEAAIRGTYILINRSPAPIDSVHLATEVEPSDVELDPPAARVLEDRELGHRVYDLAESLEPGDSLRLSFAMRIPPPGFLDRAAIAPVVQNGTYFTNRAWLPAIGYQSDRELSNVWERRAHGLGPRSPIPSPYDAIPQRMAERIMVEVVVSTAENQIALAPGVLRQQWTENARNYFRYSTDVPIANEYAIFSADYAVHEGQWNDIEIRIFHHPGHTRTLERMVRSVRASLDYYTQQFGPYPFSHVRLVEHPGYGFGMHADANTIDYEEGFSLLNPRDGANSLDLPFFVVAHEIAHQWWGVQLTPAYAEGAPVLVEGLASYSAYQVVKRAYGDEHLGRLLAQLRTSYQVPRTRAAVPLLRATDAFLYRRKGPFAMYALSQYVGEDELNGALRRLLERHRSGAPPLPTTRDLYRELQAVTPDSLRSLLHDLFEANTYWELETERASAERAEDGTWQVSLDVRTRKVVVDTAGVESEMPMDDLIQIGVFGPAGEGGDPGEPLYLRLHRIYSGEQTITVTVPDEPERAGIDPYHLLIEVGTDDNVDGVERGTT